MTRDQFEGFPDQREELYARTVVGRITLGLPDPTRPAPTMPPVTPPRSLGNAAYAPRKGDTVLVSGIDSNGGTVHPAIVTRTHTGRMINVMLLPDGAMPLPLMNIELFPNRAVAEQFLEGWEGQKPNVAYPCPSNDTSSLK